MESIHSRKEEGRQPTPYEGYGYPPMPMGAYMYPVEEEVNLLDYWRVLMKRKWQILLVTFFCVGLAVTASIFLPKKYKTEVTLMPLTSSGGGGALSGMMSQLSSIPLVGGQLGGALSGLGGGKGKELVNILKSNTLSQKVVRKNDLMRVIFAKQYEPATQIYRSNWMGVVPVEEDAVSIFQKKIVDVEEDKKTGLVKVEVTMKDPALAAKVANDMVFELQEFIGDNSLTLSKRNRIFIEEQLVKNGAKLLESGKELNNFYAQNKISSVLPQLNVDVGSYELVPKPFEEFREGFDRIQQEQGQAEKVKESASVRGVPGQVYLQYLTLNRELIARAHALLTQQYELAKIEEAKEDLAFQLIDRAEVKVRPSSPRLLLNVAVGLAGGFMLAVFIAFFREYLQKMREKEASS